MTTRREFVKRTAFAAGLLPFINVPKLLGEQSDLNDPLSINIFSKHLQFLDWSSAGAIAAEMGFAGLDLTVQPNGHVDPASVRIDLPNALNQIRAAGSECSMITTSIESVRNPSDVQIIETAASSGVQFYRSNWFKYPAGILLPDALAKYSREIKALSALNKKLGIVGCYQNHAGKDIGSSFWEVYMVLKDADPESFGVQFDIRHAMVEGGFSWENGLSLLYPQIKMIVLKDYRWEKVKGEWMVINTPIGEGMVDFTKYFKLLKKYGLRPPVSLHLEYPMGGAEKGDRSITVDPKVVFNSMKKDLNSVQRLWREA